MNKQKKLVLERSIFVFIIFVALGVIVVTEKAGALLIPKVDEKIKEYINNNYKDLNCTLLDTTYKNAIYTKKIVSKENKNHYFLITYSNKKITDTYQEDYFEGKNLLTSIQKKLKKEIEDKTNTTCDVEIIKTLDSYTTTVQERIIKEENLLELKFYTIKKELLINDWSKEEITKKIETTIEKYKEKNIIPKNYTITITNKNNITESIEISNITEDFLLNSNKEEIISDIIEDNNSKLLKEEKITYQYLN